MKAPTDYLEAAKAQEIAAQLEAQGYAVVREPSGPEQGFDLVARKGDRALAYEIKAKPALGAATEQIRVLRQKARELGFDTFRLVIVGPPHETNVRIEDLDEKLLAYLSENTPRELEELSANTIVREICYVEFDTIEIGAQAVRVVGTGVVDVMLNGVYGKTGDLSGETDFPLDFDVVLDRDLQIREVRSIRVDTSSFFDWMEKPAVLEAAA